MRTPPKPLYRQPNWQGFLLLVLVLGAAGWYFFNNRQPLQTVAPVVSAPTRTAQAVGNWQSAIEGVLADLPTPTPIPSATFTPLPDQQAPLPPPTLPPVTLPTLAPIGLLTPTIFVADRDLPPSLPSTQVAFEGQATDWPKYQPPPEEVPFGAHPYDHYFLTRPVDVSANSEYLFYYPYGSSGSDGIRVHHGIDIPNFVGQEVRAAGSGTVIWAGDGLTGERAPELGLYASYGNVIIIQHDFSWRGKPVWTLYAHLSAILVQENERVDTGRIIGLVGVSGLVTGPHVHFEVRVANNSYYSTRNPLLWMAPYIGHGVLAGRVVDQSGAFVEKASLRLFQDGVLTDRTTSYQDAYRPGRRVWSVVPDDNWRENFVLGDIPAGEYTLVATLDDFRVERPVTINPSVTTFVELVFYDRDIRATFVPPLATPLPTSTP